MCHSAAVVALAVIENQLWLELLISESLWVSLQPPCTVALLDHSEQKIENKENEKFHLSFIRSQLGVYLHAIHHGQLPWLQLLNTTTVHAWCTCAGGIGAPRTLSTTQAAALKLDFAVEEAQKLQVRLALNDTSTFNNTLPVLFTV